VNYVHGNSEVKSVRHMEQKMYYCREEYLKSAYQLKFMDGRSIPSNVLTKVVPREEFHRFVREVLGNDIDMMLGKNEGGVDRSLDEMQLLPGGAQLGPLLPFPPLPHLSLSPLVARARGVRSPRALMARYRRRNMKRSNLVRRALARGSMIVTTPHLLLLLSLDSDSNALRMAT
jgi:hypothetical protein